jgi:hypothetical protein
MLSVAFIYCYGECRYSECRYAECCYAECCGTVLNAKPINILARLRMLDRNKPLSFNDASNVFEQVCSLSSNISLVCKDFPLTYLPGASETKKKSFF